MASRLQLEILPQPDEFTCGPTCLHAIYRYWGDEIALPEVISEIPPLEDGGSLAVLLACHALRRGYRATIFTYNLRMFDPTWFRPDGPDIRERLRAQLKHRDTPKRRVGTDAFIEFLTRGGQLKLEDLTPRLIRRYLKRSMPILTGLSATYLYRSSREVETPTRLIADDVRGTSQGHFVVLCGYDKERREVLVADPLRPNPVAESQVYAVPMERVIGAVLLGILTHDANLLILEPPGRSR